MTIQEAISMIRTNGGQLSRRGNVGTLEEWVHVYKILEEDMMSDDWEVISQKTDITLEMLSSCWDKAASKFRTVKNSQESPVFQAFLQEIKMMTKASTLKE